MGARRSQRRAVRYEQDQSGCMWGLISMFDFRHGRTPRKLITDKKHGTKHLSGPAILKNKFDLLKNLGENSEGIVEGEESSGSNKPSVKKLIEEEMVNEQCPKRERGDSAVVEPKLEDDEEDRLRSVIKKAKKTRKKSRDMDTHPNPECSCKQNNADLQSVSGLRIDEIMEEFSRRIHQKGIISSCVKDGPNGEARELLRNGHSDFEDKLRAAIKEFIVQRLTNNGKKLEEDEDQRTQRRSSVFMNELELVGSEEELFLKLVQESESMFVKYVQNLKDEIPPEQKLVDARKSEEDLITNHKHRSFFQRKVIKSHEKIPAKDNSHLDDLNRIVILKPGPLLRSSKTDGSPDTVPNEEAGDRHQSSNFFLSEIKRRLKNAMGKQNHEAASRAEASNKRQTKRGVLDIGGAAKGNIGINSPTKDHFYIERNPKPRDPKTSKHESINGLPNKERISNIYMEAKKHLSELLSSGDGSDLSSRKNPKTLGRILSLPEYGASPVGSPSPGREWEKIFVGSRTRFSSEDKGQAESSSPPKESTEAEKLEKSQTSVSEDTVREVAGEEMATKDEPSLEEDSNLVKEENFVLDSRPGEPYESSSPRMDERSGSVPVIFDDDESHFTVFRQDSNEEKLSESSPPGSPSETLTAKNISDNEITCEIPERPSPVSVLEPKFSEDDISPKNPTFETLKLTLQPLRIQFEEPDSSRPTTDENPEGKGFSDDKDVILGFVKLAIQASGLDWEQICVNLLSSDQLLENPSSLGELYPNRLCSDEKLLLDCMNEVLVELCLYHFGSSPWVSFTKPTITLAPSPKSISLETFKGVHRHLLPLPLPRTLEQIVRKDMEKSGTWLDARFEIEIVGFEMSEAIFEDLIEESIFEDLVEESMLCFVGANESIEAEPKQSQVSAES